MDFTKIPLMNAMQAKLKYDSARQAVLAQNVSNVDTPDYRARDIKEPDFSAMIEGKGSAALMATTNHMHIQPGMGNNGRVSQSVERENTYEMNPIGNNVVLEEEMMKVAQNQQDYQTVLGIYKKTLNMFNIALGKSSGG